MREDCKYFQTRNFASGETARFCAIDLAPEAPWRCPADCPRYTKRVDAFVRSKVTTSTPEPELHPDAAAVLGSAEEIISAVAPELAAEERRRRQQEATAAETTWWQRLRQRGTRWRR